VSKGKRNPAIHEINPGKIEFDFIGSPYKKNKNWLQDTQVIERKRAGAATTIDYSIH
jgi:hypothetical protein